MKPWKELLADRPSDEEKRTIIAAVRLVSRQTGQKQEAVYDDLLVRGERLRAGHLRDWAEIKERRG